MRWVICLVAALWAVTCGAEVFRVPGRARSAELKVRVSAPADKKSGCEIRWAACDSLNYQYARVQSAGLASVDDASGVTLTFTRGKCEDGRRKSLSSKLFTANQQGDSVGYSLHLTATGDRTMLRAGAQRLTVECEEEPGIGSIRSLTVLPDGAARVAYTHWECDSVPAARILDVDSIYMVLGTSTDARERRWTYFDRNTDPLMSRIGGRYELATVRSDDGSGDYDIVYLGGADENTAEWPAGRVKGTMRATTLPDVYDLEWLQPDGTPVNADTGATFEGSFLVLQFPRWKATVRFRPANE